MPLQFQAISTKDARAAQDGKPDANGQTPEHAISDGEGNPCRHCLTDIPKGAHMLVLGHRPFPTLQPYAEVGPIFLCADACKRHINSETLPDMFKGWDELLMRGYDAQDRIVYGTGHVTKTSQIEREITAGFANSKVHYYHLRSASNNCFQAKVTLT
jgi:hypothetical protein